MPQSAASIGLKYNAKNYWAAGVDFSYYKDIFIDPIPNRRTAEAVKKIQASNKLVKDGLIGPKTWGVLDW